MGWRRKIWGIWTVGLLISGCQYTLVTDTPSGDTSLDVPTSLQIIVPANDFAAGRPRIPLIFYDGTEQVTDVRSVAGTAFDLSGEQPEPVWSGRGEGFSDYEIPYWVIYPELPRPGIWGFEASMTLADGRLAIGKFAIEVLADPEAPAIGEAVPPSRNRTAADFDLAALSSAVDPLPALYETTVAELVASGRPAVVVFSTPAFCQTAICAPVLDSVEAVYPEFAEQAGFLHLEIYKEFEPLVVADEVGEWALPSEPWIFVLDRTGQVAARLGGPVSPRELTGILNQVLAGGGS